MERNEANVSLGKIASDTEAECPWNETKPMWVWVFSQAHHLTSAYLFFLDQTAAGFLASARRSQGVTAKVRSGERDRRRPSSC